MSFDDFKRTWRVDDVKETERESLHDLIAIGGQGSGEEYDVKIHCSSSHGTHSYEPGNYNQAQNTIEGPREDPYTIELVRSPDGNKIRWTIDGTDGGNPTGSWTANDNIGQGES